MIESGKRNPRERERERESSFYPTNCCFVCASVDGTTICTRVVGNKGLFLVYIID